MANKFPEIYAIINLDSHQDYQNYFKKLLDFGIELIQVRSKNKSQTELKDSVCNLLKLRDQLSPHCKIIINDHPELCKEVNADGVHLGQTDSSPIAARKLLGSEAIIGLSTHNLLQIKNTPEEYLSYVALGPIFHSQTKSGHAPVVGLEILNEAAKLVNIPLVAIGGIKLNDKERVLAAGASSVAIIGDLEKALGLQEAIP